MSGTAPSTVRRIGPANYRQVPWKNGGGMSTTIDGEYREGVAIDNWSGVIWQLGRTQIITPGPFSDLSGFERLQVVISGRGLVLETPQSEIDLRRPFHPVRYDGGTPIVSRLEDGPVEVINLIGRRDQRDIDLAVLSSGGDASLLPGRHIIYAPVGSAQIRLEGQDHVLPGNHILPQDHALVIEGMAEAHVLEGVILAASVLMRGADQDDLAG